MPSPRRSALRALVALAALTVAACASLERGESPATRAAAADSSGWPALVVATAPEIVAAARAPGARATLVNVWATWCGPCREEFPDLVELHQRHREHGFRLVLVSADAPQQRDAARQFLAEQGVDFASYHKTGGDMEFIDSLDPRWSGALPASFVYDAEGRLVDFWEGMATYAMLEERVLPVLESRDAPRTGGGPS